MLFRSNARFAPALVAELRGLADGANVTLDEIWGATMINELESLMGNDDGAGHCSDIYAVSESGAQGGWGHGHNEDWSTAAGDSYYYIKVELQLSSMISDSRIANHVTQ